MGKKNDFDTTAITFRISDDDVKRFDFVCSVYGLKRGDFILNCIRSEYDKINGNPQLKKMIEQMRELSEAVKSFNVPTSD